MTFKNLIDKKWIVEPLPEATTIASLAQAIQVDETIATLLVQKGIVCFETAKQYFRPSLEGLHNPFQMKNMDKAVERLVRAIANQEKILVYGDYDVDGVTSVALVYDFLHTYANTCQFYIPDRHKEGYGVSKQAIEWAQEKGITLLITLDCGIKAGDVIALAQAAGIDVIVCDHHEADGALPPAHAILDPKQPGCDYPCKTLTGCGVGFKLLQGFLMQQGLPISILYEYLDLMAISIACDSVPIKDENRILAYHGLQKINQNPSVGIKALIQSAAFFRPLEMRQLSHVLGPRINAAGRIGHPSLALQLLLEKDPAKANLWAHELEQKNDYRRNLDEATTSEALDLIAACEEAKAAKTTFLFKEDWHKGIIGIVASRCIERRHCPTIILTTSNAKAVGSARSIKGYNIYKAITACSDLLDQYGGHAYAAGFSLPLENITAFQERFEAVVSDSITADDLRPTQVIDIELPLWRITPRLYRIIKQMAPFGEGNAEPVFCTQPVVATWFAILKGEHIKLHIQQLGHPVCLEAIGFGLASYESLLREGKPFKIAYTIEKNTYLGKATLQLHLKGLQRI
jgi:single-stranded-DNA-specific exonuclease